MNSTERSQAASTGSVVLSLSLTMGFIDAALSFLDLPVRFGHLTDVLPPVLASSVFIALVFLGARLLLAFLRLAARIPPLETGVFLGAFFVMLRLASLQPSPNALLPLGLIAVLALLAGYGAGRLALACTKSPRAAALVGALGRALPLLSLEACLLVWIQLYRLQSFLSIGSFVVSAAFLAAAFLTLVFAAAVPARYTRAGSHTVYLFLIVSSLIILTRAEEQHSGSASAGHRLKRAILIVIDTLRADALSCYGAPEGTTPNIDRLAGDGVLFTKAISCAPWTLPAMVSMLTGLDPGAHQAVKYRSLMPAEVPTLAERLSAGGYRTAALVANGMLSPLMGIGRGFGQYTVASRRMAQGSLGSGIIDRFFPQRYRHISTEELTDMTIHWLEENKGDDFFLWVHYLDPHLPYSPPTRLTDNKLYQKEIGYSLTMRSRRKLPADLASTEAKRSWIRELYRGEVRLVDENIGRLLRRLQELGLYEGCLIILTSDHGEEFWDHGDFEHGHTLYNELLRVPLIVKLPADMLKGVAPGTVVEKVVSTAALTPTILELCGIDYDSEHLSFPSLVPVMAGRSHQSQEPYSTGMLWSGQMESVVAGGAKLIYHQTNGAIEIYDLSTDPGERKPLSDPDLLSSLKDELSRRRKKAQALRGFYGVKARESSEKETIKRLRALGYL